MNKFYLETTTNGELLNNFTNLAELLGFDTENTDPNTIEQNLEEYAEDREMTAETILELIGAYGIDEYHEEDWQAYGVDSFITSDGDRYVGVKFDSLDEIVDNLKTRGIKPLVFIWLKLYHYLSDIIISNNKFFVFSC